MTGAYDDIIHLPHHVSRTRKPMSMTDRAAQFSPFAALTGHDAAIQETARLTDSGFDLAVDGTTILDERIRLLAEQQQEQPEVTVTYFVPDVRKDGGAYVTVTGNIKKVDSYRQAVLLTDGTEIPFHRIYHMDSAAFAHCL